jgi:hypothetical protein
LLAKWQQGTAVAAILCVGKPLYLRRLLPEAAAEQSGNHAEGLLLGFASDVFLSRTLSSQELTMRVPAAMPIVADNPAKRGQRECVSWCFDLAD